MSSRVRNRQGAVTLKDVAVKAGVSTMTVSNVINGVGKVSDATRMRVKAAIAATGYVPNIEARRLAGAAGTRIGLLYPDSRTPFLTEVLLATLDAAAQRGSQLVVRDSAGKAPADAEELLQQVIRAGAEGLILVPPFAELLDASSTFSKLAIPAVAFAAAGRLEHMHTVRIDNRAAAEELTAYLLDLGHTDIGFITGPQGHADSLERLEGFKAMMRRRRIPVRAALIRAGDFTFKSGSEAGEALLAGKIRPTAIIASNDDMASGVLWSAQRAGLKLPEHLSVAGFDDTVAARRMWPPLTVIHQPMADMASTAVGMLVDALTSAVRPGVQDIVHAHVLLKRESTSRK